MDYQRVNTELHEQKPKMYLHLTKMMSIHLKVFASCKNSLHICLILLMF